jgi:hypothetical protein
VDVRAYPLKGELLIEEAQIAFIQRNSVCIGTIRKTKHIYTIIDRDEYYVLIFGQTCLSNQDCWHEIGITHIMEIRTPS